MPVRRLVMSHGPLQGRTRTQALTFLFSRSTGLRLPLIYSENQSNSSGFSRRSVATLTRPATAGGTGREKAWQLQSLEVAKLGHEWAAEAQLDGYQSSH